MKIATTFIKSTTAFIIMFFAILQTFVMSNLAFGESQISSIQDAEIEYYLSKILSDVLTSQRIPVDGVNLHLVADNSINAFVYDGMNIFVNLGLLTSADDSHVIYGVLAHESGHIKGVHLVKTTDEIKNNAILSGTIGLASLAMLAIGGGGQGADAAQAGLLASGQIFNRNLLSFTRTQEREADEYALQSLKKLGISTSGVIDLFTKLKQVQNKYVANIDKYSVTHPLSDERIDFFEANKLFDANGRDFSQLDLQHCLIVAKISGFFNLKPNLLSNRSFLQNARCKLYYDIFTAISQKKWSLAIQSGEQYENLYTAKSLNNSTPEQKILDAFFYEAMGDVYFGAKNFNLASRYYQNAYERYSNTDFVVKQYQSQAFDLSNNQLQKMPARQIILQLKDIVKKTEKIFDANNTLQIKDLASQILSFAYASLNKMQSNVAGSDNGIEQLEISSTLYLAIHKFYLGQIPQAKEILSGVKKRQKNSSVKLNQTNQYLLALLEQMLKTNKNRDGEDEEHKTNENLR